MFYKDNDGLNPIKPDVMISCHYKNKDFAMKIKSDIEKLNLVVWISVEKIRGMNLTSVNSAIKNIECILICITKEYEVNHLLDIYTLLFSKKEVFSYKLISSTTIKSKVQVVA